MCLNNHIKSISVCLEELVVPHVRRIVSVTCSGQAGSSQTPLNGIVAAPPGSWCGQF